MQFSKISSIAITGVLLLILSIFTVIAIDPWTHPNVKAYRNLIRYCKNCDDAEAKAEADFKNNQITFIQLGLDEGATSVIVAKVLKTRFDINTVFGGCGPVAKEGCYHNKMVEFAIQKFGLDTLNKSILEARKLSTNQENNYPNIIYKQY